MIRYWLAKILGVRFYLWIASKSFLLLMLGDFFKRKYPEYHFLREHIREGWYCIDIGANLGYFSILMSREAGSSGKIYAVEPVQLFNDIFSSNISWLGEPNIDLYPYVLGGENKKVPVKTPVKSGIYRHGLTRLMEEQQKKGLNKSHETEMRIPDELFGELERLDFVKCDVKGYEKDIFPHFMKTLKRFLPDIQIEINSRENRDMLLKLLKPLGYSVYGLADNSLQLLEGEAYRKWSASDFYFIVPDKE